MIKQQVVTQLSIIISFKYLFYSLFITRNKRILYFTLIRCFVLPYLVYRVSPSHQKKNGYVGKKKLYSNSYHLYICVVNHNNRSLRVF